MRRWQSFVSILTGCALCVGLLAVTPAADAASSKSVRKHRESGRNYVLEHRGRVRGPWIYQPVGPAYIYYDYPYYYSRGYYPTHIGRYVYYPAYYYGRGLRRQRSR